MTLPVPHLDDRGFLDLVTEARERIRQSCPEWTDLSAHDPGMALVEAFAHLTEVMIYRLNQLPEKAYVSFLNLLGVSRHAPDRGLGGRPVHPHRHRPRRGAGPGRSAGRGGPGRRPPAGRVRHHRTGAAARRRGRR